MLVNAEYDRLCGGELHIFRTCNSQSTQHTWFRTDLFTVRNVHLAQMPFGRRFAVTAETVCANPPENVEVRCVQGSTCGSVTARTTSRITTFPQQLLVVRLVRFKVVRSTQDGTVRLEKNCQLVDVSPRLQFTRTVQFELCATIAHRGLSLRAGHYVAYVLQADNRWVCFDDPGSIRLVSENEACSKSAYMLFYRRIRTSAETSAQSPTTIDLSTSSTTTMDVATSSSPRASTKPPECITVGQSDVVLHRPEMPSHDARQVTLSHGTVVLLPASQGEYLRCIARLFEDLGSVTTIVTDKDLPRSSTAEVCPSGSLPLSNVAIVSGDMVNVAMHLAREGSSVAIHNFANAHTVGGGAWRGVWGPQEETLMQRSGGLLLNALEASACSQRVADEHLARFSYNIPTEEKKTQGLGGEVIGAAEDYCAVVVNHVNFPFDYKFQFVELSNPGFMVVSSAAPDMRVPSNRNCANSRPHLDHLVRGWQVTLWAAYQCGADCLVTGLWGCGVYENRPNLVKSTLASALGSLQLPPAFEVVFVDNFQPGKGLEEPKATERDKQVTEPIVID